MRTEKYIVRELDANGMVTLLQRIENTWNDEGLLYSWRREDHLTGTVDEGKYRMDSNGYMVSPDNEFCFYKTKEDKLGRFIKVERISKKDNHVIEVRTLEYSEAEKRLWKETIETEAMTMISTYTYSNGIKKEETTCRYKDASERSYYRVTLDDNIRTLQKLYDLDTQELIDKAYSRTGKSWTHTKSYNPDGVHTELICQETISENEERLCHYVDGVLTDYERTLFVHSKNKRQSWRIESNVDVESGIEEVDYIRIVKYLE